MTEFCNILASFTAPEMMGTNPGNVIWMYPLLLTVAVIYKATKLRVLFIGKFIKEVVVLFLTLSVFLTIAMVALIFLVQFLTS